MTPLLDNGLWLASCVPEAVAFHRATRSVARTQGRVLRAILQRSREYSDTRSVAELRDQVPLSDEARATGESVICRVPTSGTTGPTKLIPYTRSLLAEFRRGIAPWVVDLFRHNPSMATGRAYWAISPVAAGWEGFSDDAEYLGPAGGWVRSTLAVPAQVRHIPEVDAWRRETLRHLVACRELAFISVWHPSFLALLLEEVGQPARLWPRLRVISCWADAAAERPARQLASMFPQARIQPKGLIATEGFVSLPLWDCNGAALAVRSHFFEFLDGSGRGWLAHELEVGREYAVVLTTGGGLLRYRLRDRIRVTGFLHDCPLLRFVGKEDLVSDGFGEKVGEHHVRAALAGASAEFLLVAREGRTYTLYVETAGTDQELTAMGEALERALQENFHYRYCRQLGQLEAVRVFRIAAGGQRDYLRARCERGQRLGEVKPSLLQRDGGWGEVFAGGFVGVPTATGP
jgi:hypothetical protein